MPQPAVELTHVAKFHGVKPVLADVNLTAFPGEMHLILGVNGAGKSTLLRIMAGLGAPTLGTVQISGKIGYVGHSTFIYPSLSALQNLQFQANINKIKKSEGELLAVLERMGLKAHAHERAGIFSRGMAQRLNLGRMLMLEPEVWLLDEPFTGLDRASQEVMRLELAERKKAGACLFLVSHDPEQDASICTHAHSLIRGKLVDAASW